MQCRHCGSKTCKKNGFFISHSHKKMRVQRYRCTTCKISCSDQTGALTAGERKPYVTHEVSTLLMSGLSQRRIAKVLRIHPITVARKLVRLGERAAKINRESLPSPSVKTVVFDEMETFEHSKCKPVSIPIAVEEGTRRIIAVDVVSMPAKGKLAKISRAKYGPRKDDRPAALTGLLTRIKAAAPNLQKLKSDKCPRYPTVVKTIFAKAVKHQTFKGRRGCVVGQGELKKTGFDPLFSLNHTCAMVRDNIKRLGRRTWTTTKRIDRLKCLMELYAWCHNQLLSRPNWEFKMA